MGILEPGYKLTLRPMQYPKFYEHYLTSIKNFWTVEEVSFSTDLADLRDKLTPSEKNVVGKLIAFFATGDTIVSNNAVLTLYRHVNSPEVRMYYSRQLAEEAMHIQAYLTLLDNYLPNMKDREEAFNAIETIPSIKKKGKFCFKWMDQMAKIDRCDTDEQKKTFLLNLITFAAAVEGIFFFGAFAYVYYLRSRGLLHGLGSITNYIFKDESMHISVAFDIIDQVKEEYPHLWDQDLKDRVVEMIKEAVDCEMSFAE